MQDFSKLARRFTAFGVDYEAQAHPGCSGELSLCQAFRFAGEPILRTSKWGQLTLKK